MTEPDPNELVGVCTECKSEQPDSYMNKKQGWWQTMGGVPCKFCGGVTGIIRRSDIEAALRQRDRERGLL